MTVRSHPYLTKLTGWSLLVVCLALPLAACEEEVFPIIESDRYFTLFGFLDMQRDTQFVRVEPLRPTLDTPDPTVLDARVTLTNLTTGAVVTLRDSVITFSNGRIGHVFYGPLRPIPTHTYRLEVERSDGVVTRAETTVPPIPVPEVRPAQVQSNLSNATQQVLWHDLIRRPDSTAVWYRFYRGINAPFLEVPLPATDTRMEGDTWTVEINYLRHKALLTEQGVGRFPILGLAMSITVRDAAWEPPGGVFDPLVLIQPGTFSNVEHGFGFFGSAGRFSVEWPIADRVGLAIGYPIMGEQGE